MIKFNVILSNFEWEKYIKKPNSFIEKKLEIINKKDNSFKKKVIFCTLLLSGNNEIKKLNKKFRNKNKHTDILSFPFQKYSKNLKEIYLGDIIISFNHINKPRNLSNYEFRKKATKMFIHGFLHLLDFNHIKEKEYKMMLHEENKIFKSVQKSIK